jgi:peptidoglycan-N-acetylglucosamine deacetylase
LLASGDSGFPARTRCLDPRRSREQVTRARPIAIVVGTALGAHSLPALAPLCPPLAAALGIARRLPGGDDSGVLLSFDDGPHPQGTPAVLDVLAEAGVHATFFLVGEQVARWPQLAAEIAAAGHEVALHCERHRTLLRLTPRQVADDLRWAVAAIGEATGCRPYLYRPPYGIFTAAGLALARNHGWTPLLWSSDGRDWQRSASAASIADRVTRRLHAGDVILLHDADHYSAAGSWRQTAAALPRILAEIHQRGLKPRLYTTQDAARTTSVSLTPPSVSR